MATFRSFWTRRRDGDHDIDVELGRTDTMALPNLTHQDTPTTVTPLNPMPQHPNTLITSAGSLSMVPETTSPFSPADMPPQVQQVNMQIVQHRRELEASEPTQQVQGQAEKRRREPEASEPATKFRAVEGPAADLVNEQMRRAEDSAREEQDAYHQTIINKMNEDFAIIVQGHEYKFENFQAKAKETEESMKNEINEAKTEAANAQKNNVELRGMLTALQTEFKSFKEATATVPAERATSQDEGDSRAAMAEHNQKMAEMESKMEKFSQSLTTAQETIAELKDQLKATQEQASRAESDNLKYREDISTLTDALHAKEKRCEELEVTAIAREITMGADDPSSTPVPQQRLPSNASSAQPASQEEDVVMVGSYPVGADDEDMYVNGDDQDNEDRDGDDEDDEDEDMEGNTSNNVQRRKKAKSQPKPRHEKSSAVASTPAVRSQVPLPTKVASPRGGQGAPVKIIVGDQWSNRGNQPPAKRKRAYRADAVQGLFNTDDEEMDDGQENTDMDDETDDDEDKAKGRKEWGSKRLNVFSNPKRRGHNPKRAKILRMVRKLMNHILGMEKDVDVVKVDLAEPEEVERYENDQSVSPTALGFRPTIQKGFATTAWHRFLEEAFVDRFAVVHNIDLEESARDCIAVLFTDRLGRLRKKWMQLKKDMTAAERKAWQDRRASMGRRNVRRLNWYDFRRTVCLESITTPEGHEDEGWVATLEMVETLGPAGMSSDESDVQNGKPVYYVRKRNWRSAETTDRLLFVDSRRNTLNGAGKHRPGNPVRVRIRPTQNGRRSMRDPTMKCPENFYDEGYKKGLSNLYYRALKMAPKMNLGYIKDV